MTLTEIKQFFCDYTGHQPIPEELRQALSCDSRTGVRVFLSVLEKRYLLNLEEQKRLKALWFFEQELLSRGINQVAGVDEVGRGPLAGPVVAAAVILPHGIVINKLNDSKRLTPSLRSALSIKIKKTALSWSVGLASVEEIVELNIHHASMLAMRRAVEGLDKQPEFVLADGFSIAGIGFPQKGIIGGDGKSASIAAASIIAKVTRDDLMEQIHLLYPQYGFNSHKGYGTKEHLDALRRFGPCRLHRKGFAPVKALSDHVNIS